jgi:hypothetical protein
VRLRRAFTTGTLTLIWLVIAAASAAAQTPEDKALGRPAIASSVEPSRPGTACTPQILCAPGNAVDGREDTRWASEFTDTEWWQVDLGLPRQVNSVAITWENAHARRYVIGTSIDGINFAPAANVTVDLTDAQLADLAANARFTETTRFDARAARYVRITSQERGPVYIDGVLRDRFFGISIWTARVFGPSDAPPAGGSPTSPTGTPPPGFVDADGDGLAPPFDCNDADAQIFRGARDTPRDGVDQDCSGRDARFRLLDRRIEAFLTTIPSERYTKFTSMKVLGVRAGDRVRLTCKGPGCPLRRKRISVGKRRSRLSLIGQFRGSKLRRGAVVKLRITRPRTIGRMTVWKIRAPKVVKITRRCLRPGAKKPGRCAS